MKSNKQDTFDDFLEDHELKLFKTTPRILNHRQTLEKLFKETFSKEFIKEIEAESALVKKD